MELSGAAKDLRGIEKQRIDHDRYSKGEAWQSCDKQRKRKGKAERGDATA